jgi:hypothetical protein
MTRRFQKAPEKERSHPTRVALFICSESNLAKEELRCCKMISVATRVVVNSGGGHEEASGSAFEWRA